MAVGAWWSRVTCAVSSEQLFSGQWLFSGNGARVNMTHHVLVLGVLVLGGFAGVEST